jgi:hypothetical protein
MPWRFEWPGEPSAFDRVSRCCMLAVMRFDPSVEGRNCGLRNMSVLVSHPALTVRGPSVLVGLPPMA